MEDQSKAEKPNTSKIVVNFETSSFKIEYPEEYRERIKATQTELNNIRRQSDDYIDIGPTYHLQNSKGEQIMVESLSVDYTDKYDIKHRKYYLIAQDINGQIIGDRTTDVRQLEFKGDLYARAEGMTATGKRGGGVAPVIEIAHQDLLQREAQRIGRRVEWHISNVNMENLRDLQEEFRLNPTEALRKQIEEKAVEQQRWQSVYGEGGKLGFDRNGVKSFVPGTSESSSSIPKDKIKLPPADKELIKQAKKDSLDRIMSRMENISASSQPKVN